MTLIRVTSDWHAEFYKVGDNSDFFIPHDENDKDSILVIAGDLCESRNLHKIKKLMDFVCHRFKHVLYVMGNHDHYFGYINDTKPEIHDIMKEHKNFHILENESIVIDDTKFIGCTLWTDYNKSNYNDMLTVRLNDNELIKLDDGSFFEPSDSVEIHKKSIEFIENELNSSEYNHEKTVIITHHGPSRKSIHAKYAEPPYNRLNCAFISELDDFILKYQPKYWIHGHIHDNMEYKIGETTVIANPFGYPHEYGNNFYSPKKFIIS